MPYASQTQPADTLALFDALVEERDEQAWAVTYQYGLDTVTTLAFGEDGDEVAERIRELLSDGSSLKRVVEWDS